MSTATMDPPAVPQESATRPDAKLVPPTNLRLVHPLCCLCGVDDTDPIGVGEDFEYRSCPDSFLAVKCRRCGLVFLNPRPDERDLGRIYPPEYHSFQFDRKEFGIVYSIRRRLERMRLKRWTRQLPADAAILDVGCGDGFHLSLLRELGPESWSVEGVEADPRAAQKARECGAVVHEGRLEDRVLPEGRYDLILMIMIVEHAADPRLLMQSAARLLKPGGRVVIVTDNTRTLSFTLFQGRHWGGYHFPRHWNLFNRGNLRTLADTVGLTTERIRTAVSPVNWVYSIHNWLVDWHRPGWLSRRFTLKSPVSLTFFTLFDRLLTLVGRGALLHGEFRKPTNGESR